MDENTAAPNQVGKGTDAGAPSSAPPEVTHRAPREVSHRAPREVSLRAPVPADVPLLYAFENDPAWCAMAMLKPRSWEAFEAVWAKLFAGWTAGDTRFFQRTILADGEACGTIGVRPVGAKKVGTDGAAAGGERFDVGYGLGRAHWGRGIASRALGLILEQVPRRPLYATVAASNTTSIRVLEKHGFAIVERFAGEESERYLACEEVTLMLA